MMWRVLLLCLHVLLPQDEPKLVPGLRLEGVSLVPFEVTEPGAYTLGRSDGALILDGERSDTGWLIAELDAGTHVVELPGEPGDVTALAGAVEVATAAAFLNSGIRHLDAREHPEARIALLACRARPGTAAFHGLSRMLMGCLLQREGRDLAEARDLLLGSREAVVGFGDPTMVAALEESLGQVALALGDWDLAQQCFERQHAAAVDPGLAALSISRMAQAAAGRGDHDGARSLHEEALAALVEDSEPTYVSTITFMAGKWFQSRAEFARAALLLERSAASAPNWHQQVDAFGQLGVVELMRGHYGAALGLMDRAQALADPHMPSEFDARLLQNRAALAFSLGEFGTASESMERLLPQAQDADDRATIRTNLALLALMQDDEKKAATLYDEALAEASATGRARWLALNGKAALLFTQDLPKQAAPLTVEALKLAEKLDDPFLRTVSLMGASEANCRLGKLDEARAQAEASVASLEAQDARDFLLPALHGVARAALMQGDEATVGALLDRAWKESARDEIAALSSLEEAQVRSRLAELSDWGSIAVDLAARRAGSDKGAVAEGLRRTAQWKSHTLLAAVEGPTGVPANLVPALQSLLGDRALIEYAAGDRRLYAYVLQGKDLRLVDLGERRAIDALVQSYLAGINDLEHLAGAAEVAAAGGQLYRRLLAPLSLSRSGLVIVPCGELTRLPFEALVVAAPEDATRFDEIEFVLDRMDVGYAPSSAALVALAQRPKNSPAGGALLLGDPTYIEEMISPELVAARGEAANKWPRLKQTRDELTRIARMLLTLRDDELVKDDLYDLALLEDTRDVSLSTQSFELRLGREASVAALASLAPSARLIHIAAHAHVDRQDSHRTGLVLAWDESGQGLFSLADIAALKLDADLVVLSACRTADGRLLNGEGIQSIAGAFLAAGARGVVATLWKVQDVHAQPLMEDFEASYLTDGESPDRALRRARRDMRTGSSVRGESLSSEHPDAPLGHPHYWAAFLFSGATAARAR